MYSIFLNVLSATLFGHDHMKLMAAVHRRNFSTIKTPVEVEDGDYYCDCAYF